MVRYLFYTIGDLTYQSPLVHAAANNRWVLPRKRENGFPLHCCRVA